LKRELVRIVRCNNEKGDTCIANDEFCSSGQRKNEKLSLLQRVYFFGREGGSSSSSVVVVALVVEVPFCSREKN